MKRGRRALEGESELRQAIGRRLRMVRKAYAQAPAARIAKLIGVDAETWRGYEGGTRGIPFSKLVLFVQLTGATSDFILLGRLDAVMPAALVARMAAQTPDAPEWAPAQPAAAAAAVS